MFYQKLSILYGSQTGTAQDLAEEIWRHSKKLNFTGPVLSMDEYDVRSLISERLVIFVCSTTGQGEEPDNMRNFWKFLLRKDLPSESLEKLEFAVLGLGDSSYPKFNYAAKRLHKRLMQLSARPIVPLDLCDDQHDLGLYAAYYPWIKNVWETLKEKFMCNEAMEDPRKIFKWKVTETKSTENVDIETLQWPLENKSFKVELKENVRTTKEDHFQDVRLLSFTCGNLDWEPGDVVVVRPWNSEEDVETLFNIFKEAGLKYNEKTTVDFMEIHEEIHLPVWYRKPISLGLAAKYLWDLKSVPRQRALELLALNCDNEMEKEKLIEFTTPEGLEDFLNYATRPKRTILEVFTDFPNATAKLTIPTIFELFQIIQPRYFSIASVKEYGLLEILVAVVEYKTKLSKPRKGLCSNWLKTLLPGQQIPVSIKRGTFNIPREIDVPIIMVGPGTGVAPFRSIIMKEILKKNDTISPAINLYLFFGCRNKEKDFHFQKDLTTWVNKKMLQLFTAFSRDQEEKRYVQHLIKEQMGILKVLITEKNALIFVAGSSKNMPDKVKEAFIEVVGDAEYINSMIKRKTYQEETWS